MRQRAEALMIKILQYAYKMLIWSENSSVPPELRSSVTKDSQLDLYYTMLLNDEIHTYDQVCCLSIIISSPPAHPYPSRLPLSLFILLWGSWLSLHQYHCLCVAVLKQHTVQSSFNYMPSSRRLTVASQVLRPRSLDCLDTWSTTNSLTP